MRDFEMPGRSLAVARDGMAATSHPLSTVAALNVLQAGGNAMDAAVTACAVQCVVEPGSTGIGGDCFALYAPRGGDDVVAFNGSGRAPAAATTEWYRERGIGAIERQSPHSVTVPGAVEAWERLLADHGTVRLADAIRPAIAYARDGYPVLPRTQADWANQVDVLARDAHASRTFLVDGAAPAVGTLHRQPELADTLQAIAEGGSRAFYEGPVAADMVDGLRALGGLHSLDDFASARGEYVAPISTSFRGHEIHQCPQNGQGVIALMILNILSRFEPHADPLSPDRLHVEAEATRLAYGIRDRYLGDHVDMPIDWMLSDGLAGELAARIDLASAMPSVPAIAAPEHRDTVYISVVDRDRNAASFINSVFYNFGAGIVSPKTGVLFHNRGQSFVVEPGHLNTIGPGKRPLHTIIPGMMTRGGRTVMSFGVMGGHYQAMGHAHLVSKVLDYGLDVQSAIDLPRLFPRPDTGLLDLEGRLFDTVGPELKRRGFNVGRTPSPLGGAQAIAIDWVAGTLLGGSDPRKDGSALGF